MKNPSVSKQKIKISSEKIANKKIGIVKSSWNSLITDRLHNGCRDTLLKNGIKESNIHTLMVPGSFELIYGSKKIHEQHQLDAIIAIGSVIKGETPHFDIICSSVANGIKDLNILFNIPFIFCVSTDFTLEQAIDRSGGNAGNKGIDCAYAAMQLIQDT